MNPLIEVIEINSRFKYLWLKYVRGVNLNYHCAKCLIGDYSEKIINTMFKGRNIELDEYRCGYYYLCGVSIPYVWRNNFHLAFRYSEGKKIKVERNGIRIIISDAEEIPIVPVDLNSNKHPRRFSPEFFTCRNWQFANMIKEELDAED